MPLVASISPDFSQDTLYIVSAFNRGLPAANQVMCFHLMGWPAVFPKDLSGSFGRNLVPATAQTDFDIQKNGVSVGTMRFAIGAAVASFIFAAAVSFNAGDRLQVIAPAVPDATLSDVTFTILGVRP